MNIIKLIVLGCPFLVASMMVITNPAQAAVVKSTPVETQVTLVSAESTSDSEFITHHFSQQSDPIREYLGCGCTKCVQASQLLQGKLPL